MCPSCLLALYLYVCQQTTLCGIFVTFNALGWRELESKKSLSFFLLLFLSPDRAFRFGSWEGGAEAEESLKPTVFFKLLSLLENALLTLISLFQAR